MSNIPHFHGSDIEEIEKYYGIPKEELVGFGANVNPLGLSDNIKTQLAARLDIITTYPDRNYVSLRDAIGNYCNVNREYIVVGNGSTELISLLIQHVHPRKALLLGPTYSEYERELALCGGEMIYYDLTPDNEFLVDLDDLLPKLDETIDLLILCNPNNPTSTAITTETMEQILLHCKKYNIFVMVDETYIEFAPDISEFTSVPLAKSHDNLMVIRGVSKFFAAPGLRLGYAITSNVEFMSLIHTHQNPWSLNSIGALAGELMVQDKDYIERTRELIHSERERIYAALQEIPELHSFKPVANFFLVRILKPGVTSFDLFDYLVRQKLMIRDCSSFTNLKGEYIRFCIMLPEDNTRLLNGLKTYFS